MSVTDEAYIPQQHVAAAQLMMNLRRHRDVAGEHRRIDAVHDQPTGVIHQHQKVRHRKAQPRPHTRGYAVMAPQGRCVGHRIGRAVNDKCAMAVPAVRSVTGIVTPIQLSQRPVNDEPVHAGDHFNRQTRPRGAPRRVGEVPPGQMTHRGAGDIAVRDLLREQPQRLTGREQTPTKTKLAGAGQLIDTIGREKMIRRPVANAGQRS